MRLLFLRCLNKINFNIALSLAINFTAMFLAIFGIINPVIGALIHNLGSVLVIINSSLLLNYGINNKDNKSHLFNLNKDYFKSKI